MIELLAAIANLGQASELEILEHAESLPEAHALGLVTWVLAPWSRSPHAEPEKWWHLTTAGWGEV